MVMMMIDDENNHNDDDDDNNNNNKYIDKVGARSGVMVKALRYKPAGCGFDSRWCHWNFSVT